VKMSELVWEDWGEGVQRSQRIRERYQRTLGSRVYKYVAPHPRAGRYVFSRWSEEACRRVDECDALDVACAIHTMLPWPVPRWHAHWDRLSARLAIIGWRIDDLYCRYFY